MRRLMLYDRLGNPLGELAEADVFEAVLREEINGEHSLEITTTRVLDKGIRLLYEDGRSKWREFVVAGVDAEHASGNRAIGTYYCVWSVQQDLQGVTVSVMPGVQSPTTAALALTSLLSTTSRWARGTVTQTSTGGASMYDRSAWEALSTLVEVWGGEVDATIEISTQSGVTGRKVNLYAAQGEQTAMRRFDFGADLMSVKRTLADSPLFCRISPRGKGEQTDAGGYGRKITIESVNSGRDWLEYAPMVDAAKLPDGNGGYEYPTLIVENSDCETPADLKAWGESVLAQYCTPKVTYEVDVVQAGIEGVDVSGVSLGDAVQVVDRKFGGAGIRVQGRVRSITTDLLNERDITIVIGDAEQSISSKFAKVDKSLASVNNDLTVMSTADYIDNLLDRINTEINATGGYTYIVPGHGILTFDVAVADPLNPVEASQVVEVKGGSIRIANSKTAQGAWEWKTVFTSGHIAAEMVTAANLTTGYIGNASHGSYWNLDTGELRIADLDLSITNLVRNGDFEDGTNYWERYTTADSLVAETDVEYGYRLKYVQSDVGGRQTGWMRPTSSSFRHVDGKTYTISFYAKADSANKLYVSDGTNSDLSDMESYSYIFAEDVTTEWERFTGTLTADGSYMLYISLENAGTLYMTDVMLVEGTSVIAWAPDPRDQGGWREYLHFDTTNGLDVGASGSYAKTRIKSSGVELFDSGNNSMAFFGDSGSEITCRVGSTGGNVRTSSDGEIEIYGLSGKLAHIGHGVGMSYEPISGQEIGNTDINYFEFGSRRSGTRIGDYSMLEGYNCVSSHMATHAEGEYCEATNVAAHAEGYDCEATGRCSHAQGEGCIASGVESHAGGYHCTASGAFSFAHGSYSKANHESSFALGTGCVTGRIYQTVLGKYNTTSNVAALIVGDGDSSSSKSNLMYLNYGGNMWIRGNYSSSSDRRLKKHISYLEDDACEFVRKLKPALFEKEGERHLGFYAQDVDEADVWDTATVEPQHTDDSLDFDPLTLEYTALIAPLVAYCQHLEKRVDELEKRIAQLEGDVR